MSAMQDALRVEIQIRHALHDLSKKAGKESDVAVSRHPPLIKSIENFFLKKIFLKIKI